MEMTLRLPNNYVEIEEEEMMYLDGGYWTHVGHAEWTWTIDARACTILAAYAVAGATISELLGKIGVPYAKQVATIFELSSAIFGIVAAHGGEIRIYFHTMVWGRTPRWINVIK